MSKQKKLEAGQYRLIFDSVELCFEQNVTLIYVDSEKVGKIEYSENYDLIDGGFFVVAFDSEIYSDLKVVKLIQSLHCVRHYANKDGVALSGQKVYIKPKDLCDDLVQLYIADILNSIKSVDLNKDS